MILCYVLFVYDLDYKKFIIISEFFTILPVFNSIYIVSFVTAFFC